MTATFKPEVAKALEELGNAFSGTDVSAFADVDGGAWVTIGSVDIGDRWTPSTTWLGFHIAATYPYADVYPLFIDGSVQLSEGGSLPEAVTAGARFEGRPDTCLQVSRRSNRWNPTIDTVAIKVTKVIAWLRDR